MDTFVEKPPLGMTRRDLICRVLLSAVAITGVSDEGFAAQSTDGWKPQFFTADQNETLIALGERIIPGSTAAQCNRVIDLVMTVETPEVREQVTQAIAAFEAKARSQFGQTFNDLSPQQQDAVLTEEAQKSARTEPFAVVKEWMADVYWSSRDGMSELGWNGQMAWPAYTACDRHAAS